MKKNLIHFFAVIGFGTFILLACSVDDIADSMNNNNNSQITSTTGKYQVTNVTSKYIAVLNTETGVMKTFRDSNNQADIFNWVEETNGNPTITFTH